MTTTRFGSLKAGSVFKLTDDRAAVVTQALAKVNDTRAVMAGGVAWFDMRPDHLVEVVNG